MMNAGEEDLQLRPYQIEGAKFLADHWRCGLIDEPGLGKTVQALYAVSLTKRFPVVIFAPKSALGVWRDEICRWMGSDVADATVLYRGSPSQRVKLQPAMKKCKFLITSYRMAEELLQQHKSKVLPIKWATVICDEYHSAGLLNNSTQTFKAVKRLAETCNSTFYAVSGTPYTKGPQDFYALLNIFDKAQTDFCSYWRFVYKYCIVTQNIYGYREIATRPLDILAFRQMLAGYFLRRRKVDVLGQLPEKVRSAVPIEMSARQRALYAQFESEMMVAYEEEVVTAFSAMLKILRLRQVLVSPRCLHESENDWGGGVEALVEMLNLDFSAGNSALIFTPFVQGVTTIADYIKMKIPECVVFVIHGQLGANRLPSDIANEFQRACGPKKVIVSTIKAGNAWTATDASTVYFLGYEWGAHENIQAEDRAHRIGQTKNVQVRYLMHENTIDSAVLSRVTAKDFGNAAILDPHRFMELLARDYKIKIKSPDDLNH